LVFCDGLARSLRASTIDWLIEIEDADPRYHCRLGAVHAERRFLLAELAIVSSRRSHLERLAKEGRPGAEVALALAADPARMLAAVQVGFTTSATLAGIFSGATLADSRESLSVPLEILPAFV